ncbi:MAG: methyltransferase domain-containing protein [Candidatus Micrarchaeota archaeon]
MREYDFSKADYAEDSIPGHLHYLRLKCDALASMVSARFDDASVLDVGCATGEAEELLKGKMRLTGVDPAENFLGVARKRKTGARFVRGDALSLPFQKNSFDAAFAFSVLHHLKPGKEREKAVSEMARVVRKGGLVIIGEHNPNNPLTRRIVAKTPMDAGVSLLSVSEVEELFTGAGLRTVEKKFVIFFPHFLSFLAPLEKAFETIPLGGNYVIAAQKP